MRNPFSKDIILSFDDQISNFDPILILKKKIIAFFTNDKSR